MRRGSRTTVSQMPRPAKRDEHPDKFARYRATQRTRGMKLLRIWVPDPNAPGFQEEVERQAALLRGAPEEVETMDFIEAVAAWPTARTSSRSTACWRSQSGSPTGPGRNERDPAVKGPCKAGASAAVPVGGLDHASEPDALAGVVPFDARERLSPLLADDDVATLKHLVREGMEASTLPGARLRPRIPRSLLADDRLSPPRPAPEDRALTFVVHHLRAPVQREADPNHGMQRDVADGRRARERLRVDGPNTPKTWSMLHRWRGLQGPSKPFKALQSPSPAGRAGLRRPPSRRKRVPSLC